jgi:hypothetical protein
MNVEDTGRLRAMDGSTLMRVLSHVSAEALERPDTDPIAVHTAGEARELVGQFLAQNEHALAQGMAVLPEGDPAEDAARRMLGVLLDDPALCEVARPLFLEPPAEEQKSVEAAIGVAVVLGALVTWLQTRMRITVRRGKDGKLLFSFEMNKEAIEPDLIARIVETVSQVITGK